MNAYSNFYWGVKFFYLCYFIFLIFIYSLIFVDNSGHFNYVELKCKKFLSIERDNSAFYNDSPPPYSNHSPLILYDACVLHLVAGNSLDIQVKDEWYLWIFLSSASSMFPFIPHCFKNISPPHYLLKVRLLELKLRRESLVEETPRGPFLVKTCKPTLFSGLVK